MSVVILINTFDITNIMIQQHNKDEHDKYNNNNNNTTVRVVAKVEVTVVMEIVVVVEEAVKYPFLIPFLSISQKVF